MRRFERLAANLAANLAVATLLLMCCPREVAGQQPSRQPAQPPSQGQREAATDKIARPWTGDLDGMIERRLIRVATAYNRTLYFIDKGVQRGAVYEAYKLFEDQLNARLKTRNLRVNVMFVPVSRDELLRAVAEGRADIAAAALTITPERRKIVDFAPGTYGGIDEIIVTGPGAPAIASVDDLSGQTVFVRQSSSYYASLSALNAALAAKGKKPVTIKAAPEELETEDILEMVNAGLVKITVADDYLAKFWKQILPEIELHEGVAVRTGAQVAPAIRKNSPQLMKELSVWIAKNGERTMFGNLMLQRYLKNTKFAKSATAPEEMQRFQQVVDVFRKYSEQYQLDFLLMLAQGFQESGLDQTVKSQVGAIGVMQVMPATGKELKVGDITQIENNIHAGVKYIRFMIDEYFANEPMTRLDKGLFAFAAYNAGPGRIRQLRKEAASRGLDPNVWFNNVERIASERIGRETVTYVSNIHKYYVAYRLAVDEMEERRKVKSP